MKDGFFGRHDEKYLPEVAHDGVMTVQLDGIMEIEVRDIDGISHNVLGGLKAPCICSGQASLILFRAK